MPRFIARPIIVEAFQFLGDIALMPEDFRRAVGRHLGGGITEVVTGEGVRPCRHSDWIVRGSDGTFSVIRDTNFEAAFEPHAPARRAENKRMSLNG